MYTLNYIYLHGFGSSPKSAKGQYLANRIDLIIPDLNRGDFTHLTLTRQLEQIGKGYLQSSASFNLIGSSFGGLTAAWLGEKHQNIDRLVLLAPAFNFLSHWLPKLGQQQLKQWQETGYLSIYHYGEATYLPLHYQFILDLDRYQEKNLQRSIPTLILHGIDDDVIAIDSSRHYTSTCPWVKLIELKDDHTLSKTMPQIWQAIRDFCNI